MIPTVDVVTAKLREICALYPDLCSTETIGHSRSGEPLVMLTIGHGGEHALVIGGPHANEPVGFLTVLRLARLLCEGERHGLTWHLIGCVDPDGARLNEGWYGGPFTVAHHHRHVYRPALADQPEWTFPVNLGRKRFDRPLPETRALMRVIDDLRPAFLFSLHNADFGGAYFQISRDLPGLPEALADLALAHGVPLDLAPIDTLGYQVAGPGVTLLPPADRTDFADTAAERAEYGAASWHYADRHGTFTLIAEVPLWTSPGCDDRAPAGVSQRELLEDAIVRLRHDIAPIERLRGDTGPRRFSPFHSAVDDTLDVCHRLIAAMRGIATAPGSGRTVSRAEVGGIQDTVRRLALRSAGMFVRLLENEPDASLLVHAEARAVLRRLSAAAHTEVITPDEPLARIVGIQTQAALTTAAHLMASTGRKRWPYGHRAGS
ncbi:MAG: dehydrogenase [Nonomuraea sp.]|nr:dehydrogenase [Nonomuraea sp.]